MEGMFEALASISRDFPCKAFIAFIVASVNFLIGDPKSAIISGIGILILFDWITGIIAAWYYGEFRFSGGEELKKVLKNSLNKMGKGLTKMILYFVLCLLAYQLSVKIHPLLLGFLDDMVYAYIALTEALSILDNINKICLSCCIDMPFIPHLIKQVKKVQKTIDKTDDKKKEAEKK